jgi:hypothetical protein
MERTLVKFLHSDSFYADLQVPDFSGCVLASAIRPTFELALLVLVHAPAMKATQVRFLAETYLSPDALVEDEESFS